MPLTRVTRANLEASLVGYCGPSLTLVGLDGTTVNGSNASLNDPIASALGSLGLAVSDLAAVSDADLAAVTTVDQLGQLKAVARLEALEMVLASWVQPDQTADTDNRQDLGKLRDGLEKTVARLRAQAERQYGFGLGSLTPGVLDLGFQETIDYATGIPD